MMDLLEVHYKLSTAYYAQTDGQIERLNQVLKQFFRCYVNYEQTNWVELLPAAQIVYNSTATNITEMSPFFANYGFNLIITAGIRGKESLSKQIKVKYDKLINLYQELTRDIE